MNVLKIGGAAGNDHTATLKNLARRIQNGERWILVHGTSDKANTLGKRLGVPPKTITSPGGHESRYTDPATLEIYRMAAAAVNQDLVCTLMGEGVRCVGFASPNIIHAERKKAIRALKNGRQMVIRDDYSGKIKGIYGEALLSVLDAKLTPIIAPLAISEEHEPLNIDGDLAAASIARAVSAENLVILTNVAGLLKDVSDPTSVISQIKLSQIDQYDDIAAGRMKKKLMAAQNAAAQRTILASSAGENPIDAALNGGGTHFVKT